MKLLFQVWNRSIFVLWVLSKRKIVSFKADYGQVYTSLPLFLSLFLHLQYSFRLFKPKFLWNSDHQTVLLFHHPPIFTYTSRNSSSTRLRRWYLIAVPALTDEMAGRYDSNPFEEEDEVNPFAVS